MNEPHQLHQPQPTSNGKIKKFRHIIATKWVFEGGLKRNGDPRP